MITTPYDRDECLIDESIKETFPASDSPTAALPGSLLAVRYATGSRGDDSAGSHRRVLQFWLIGALIAGAVVGAILRRGRGT
jgi:hypothetical protein